MPFVPTYSEATEALIIANLMVVIERDMKAALDNFYLSDNLPAFAVMADGEPSVFSYPLLVLGVQRMVSVETVQIDEGNYLDQVLTVGAGIAIQSATTLKDVRVKAKKYVRAFKAVVRSAAASDLLPSTARILNHAIDIEHRYLQNKTDGTNFIQEIAFEIKIRFGES